MSFSQFTMAALVQRGTHLAICGDLTAEEGRTLKSAAIFFVVHQGDSVVRGRGTYRPGTNEWGACADLAGQRLSVGQAVAMGLVVVERDVPFVAERAHPVGFSDSVGFTTFTWMQDIPIQDGLPAGRQDPCA
jgi:hypothetical protein